MTGANMVRACVVGASGYTGAELLRLLVGHPQVRLIGVTADRSAGRSVHEVFPHLINVLPPLSFDPLLSERVMEQADVIFFAMPHGKASEPVARALATGKRVIDLSADYRLADPALYERWYDSPHPHPDLLARAVYGLPELHAPAIVSAHLVASPGCYPTAALLQLAPLVAHQVIELDSIVIDAKSGISGAGRTPALPYHFPEAHESLEAYKVGNHRHIPEIEQELRRLACQGPDMPAHAGDDLRVLFVPHLVPMNRGILSTAYARVRAPMQVEALSALYRDFFKGQRFIRLLEKTSPNPRHVRGTNFCDLAIGSPVGSPWVVTIAALDNLIKGAAGQAIQAMNLMCGFPQEAGLTAAAVFP